VTEEPKKNKLLKIAVVILLIGAMSGTYTFMNLENEDVTSCGPAAGCEHPAPAAPLICQSSDDCELRGKDEWESCEHKSAPRQPVQEGRPSRDQTSKSQEGFFCSCVEKQCQYFKP